MMGERTVIQESLLYGLSLEDHVPADYLLRSLTGSLICPASAITCGFITTRPGGHRSTRS